MNISIYNKYKIKCENTYTYEDFDYEDLQERTDNSEYEMDGGEFVEKILAPQFNARNFSEVNFNSECNIITIEFFDPMTGHTAYYRYELTEVPKER